MSHVPYQKNEGSGHWQNLFACSGPSPRRRGDKIEETRSTYSDPSRIKTKKQETKTYPLTSLNPPSPPAAFSSAPSNHSCVLNERTVVPRWFCAKPSM